MLLASDVSYELIDSLEPLLADKALQRSVRTLLIEATLGHLLKSDVRHVIEGFPVFFEFLVLFQL